MQDIKLCEICGGAISITNLFPLYRTYPGDLAAPIKLCSGHGTTPAVSTPEPEHNGWLDPQGKYWVIINQDEKKIIIEDSNYADPDHDYTELTPAQALSLFAWLQQNQDLLKKLDEDKNS
jgi:hypothetical protein